MEVSGVDAASVDEDDIGYRLGPRLNAAGRIKHARLALDLLLTGDEETGRGLALDLDTLNRERQRLTADAAALAAEIVGDGEPPALIMIGHEDFSSGIVGLVASRIVELYGRPAVVYERGAETSRASCRSIDEFHITDALRSAEHLFVRFGGHRAAAGFTAENGKLDQIEAHLVAEAERALAGRDLAPVIEIDCNLPLRHVRGEEIRWLSRLGPFGVGNPEPAFLARNVLAAEARLVGDGEQHLKLKLRDGAVSWPAIGFGLGETGVQPGDRIDVVYSLSAGRGNTLELVVKDLRKTDP
jgi:single-stranded-DNA-specific exonuclease